MIWEIDDLVRSAKQVQAQINGVWIPARPLLDSSWIVRMRAAWLVLTGHADAVVWGGGQ